MHGTDSHARTKRYFSGRIQLRRQRQGRQHPKDGWQTASLDDVGIKKNKLGDLVKHIRRKKYQNIHSLLIIKDGKLVFEECFDGYLRNPEFDRFRGKYIKFDLYTKDNIMSVAKAFTSVLLGIAIDHGFIQSVDEKLFSFFSNTLLKKMKEKATLLWSTYLQ